MTNPVSLVGFFPTEGTHFSPNLLPDATSRTQLIAAREPTNHPTKKPTNQPTSQPTNEKPTNRPTNKRTKKKPTNQPASQRTKKPTNWPTSQRTKKPTNQPTNQTQPHAICSPILRHELPLRMNGHITEKPPAGS